MYDPLLQIAIYVHSIDNRFRKNMSTDDSDDDQPIVLNKLNDLYTPKKKAIFDQIEHEYRTGPRSGRRLRELQMQRRGPNDFIRAENRYNTEHHDPLEDDDDDRSSINSFVASDNSVEESEENSGEDESEEENDDNDDEASLDSGALRRNGCQTTTMINEEEVDVQIQSPASESDERSETPDYPFVCLPAKSPNRKRQELSSDDEGPSSSLFNAPKKRRRDELDEDTTPGIRRSARASAAHEAKEKAKKELFGSFRKDFQAKRDRMVALAKKSLAEMPEREQEEEEPKEVADTPPAQAQFVKVEAFFNPIESLTNVPDNTMVNIRGKISYCGMYDTRPAWSGSTDRIPIRNLRVQDASGSVAVTLWRHYVDNEYVKPGAYIALYGLKKSTFRDKPQLNTYYNTLIRECESPAEDLNPVKSEVGFPSIFVIEGVYEAGTTVYTACPKPECRYAKADLLLLDGTYRCRKCTGCYSIEETLVGVAMRVAVADELADNRHDAIEHELATIFTTSVRKVYPGLPETWGEIVDRDRFKDDLIEAFQKKLPCTAECSVVEAGNLTIYVVGGR